MKSQFIKQLEKKQKIFIATTECNDGTWFFFRGFDIPISSISENEYIGLKANDEFIDRLAEIGVLLGMSIHLSFRNIAVSVYFKGDGFWCNEKYYGKLMYEVAKHLQWCLGNNLILDINAKPISVSTFKKKKHSKRVGGY